jgi:hypothetical protein
VAAAPAAAARTARSARSVSRPPRRPDIEATRALFPIGFAIAPVVGLVVAYTSRPILLARAVWRLQPMLATTVGELPTTSDGAS